MNTRMDRSRLNIGTYFLAPYACDEAHVRELKQCGIDFVVCMQEDRPTLDLFAKYGIGAVLTGILPAWWGGDGDRAGQLQQTNPPEKYLEAAKAFTDHPAVWGIDTGDEPSALDFPYYGQVIDLVEKNFPAQFAYLNLYPNYASVSQNDSTQTVNQLGTKTYAEHIERYCREVPTDYICYDFYMYSASVAGAYQNLRIVSDACLRTGRSMWIVLQVNSNREEEWISTNQLRFQAYSALAFGAQNLIWACYTAGWWFNQVLDEHGNKTQQYEKLKEVNAELARLGDAYMRYQPKATYFIGFENSPELSQSGETALSALDTEAFRQVRAENGESLLAGEMTSRAEGGSSALFLCSADDPLDQHPKAFNVLFNSSRKVKAVSGTGERALTQRPDGSYCVSLRSCDAVLLMAE